MQIKIYPYRAKQKKRKKKTHQTQTRDVSQRGLAIDIKEYLKAKKELWNLKYFTMQKYINLQKIL
jgi:ribosomal protein S25